MAEQLVEFAVQPGKDGAYHLALCRRILLHVQKDQPTQRKFAVWLRDNQVYDRTLLQFLLKLCDVKVAKNATLGEVGEEVAAEAAKGGPITSIPGVPDPSAKDATVTVDGFKKALFDRFVELNGYLAKFIFTEIADGFLAHTEMVKRVEAGIYRGSRPVVLNFNAWLDWMKWLGYLKAVGFRIKLSDAGFDAFKYLREIPDTELLDAGAINALAALAEEEEEEAPADTRAFLTAEELGAGANTDAPLPVALPPGARDRGDDEGGGDLGEEGDPDAGPSAAAPIDIPPPPEFADVEVAPLTPKAPALPKGAPPSAAPAAAKPAAPKIEEPAELTEDEEEAIAGLLGEDALEAERKELEAARKRAEAEKERRKIEEARALAAGAAEEVRAAAAAAAAAAGTPAPVASPAAPAPAAKPAAPRIAAAAVSMPAPPQIPAAAPSKAPAAPKRAAPQPVAPLPAPVAKAAPPAPVAPPPAPAPAPVAKAPVAKAPEPPPAPAKPPEPEPEPVVMTMPAHFIEAMAKAPPTAPEEPKSKPPIARLVRPGARISFSSSGDAEVVEESPPKHVPAAAPTRVAAPVRTTAPATSSAAPRSGTPAAPLRTAASTVSSTASSTASSAAAAAVAPRAAPPAARAEPPRAAGRGNGSETVPRGTGARPARAESDDVDLDDLDTTDLFNESAPSDDEDDAGAARAGSAADEEDEEDEREGEDVYRRRLEADARAAVEPLDDVSLRSRLEALTAEVGEIVRSIDADVETRRERADAPPRDRSRDTTRRTSAPAAGSESEGGTPRMRILDFEGNVFADSAAAEEEDGTAGEATVTGTSGASGERRGAPGEGEDLEADGEGSVSAAIARLGTGTETGVIGDKTAAGEAPPERIPTERFGPRRTQPLAEKRRSAGQAASNELRAALRSPALGDEQVDLLAAQWESGPGRRTITAEELGLDPQEYAGEKRSLFLFKLAVAATLLEGPGTVSAKLDLLADLEEERALDNVFVLDWSLDRTLETLSLLGDGRELSPLEERLIYLPVLKRALASDGTDVLRRIETSIGRRAAALRACLGNSVGAGAYWIEREMRRLGLW